jgi:hypothetical protein
MGGANSMRAAILAVLVIASVIKCSAEVTGNQVLEDCQKAIRFSDNGGGPANENYDAGWCIGWVNSVLSLTGLTNQWSDFTKSKPTLLQFCPPKRPNTCNSRGKDRLEVSASTSGAAT